MSRQSGSNALAFDDIVAMDRPRPKSQPAIMHEMIGDDDDEIDRESMNSKYGQVHGKVLESNIHSHPLTYQVRFMHVGLLGLFAAVVPLQATFVSMSDDKLTAQVFILVFVTLVWMMCTYQWNNIAEEVLILKVSSCGIKSARERETSLSVAGALLQSILLVCLTSSVAFVRADQVVTWIFVCVIIVNAILILLVAFFVEKAKRNLIHPA
jgi:hypothetical protein